MLELHRVLYMPGMRVNVFSLQRIRNKGSCSYAFAGNPQPGKKIPIFDNVTMRKLNVEMGILEMEGRNVKEWNMMNRETRDEEWG